MNQFTDRGVSEMDTAKHGQFTGRDASAREPKLSNKGYLVLSVISPSERLYGREIIDRTGMFSGTLYPLLRKLENCGWLEHEYEDGDEHHLGRPLRIYYTVTPSGLTQRNKKLLQIEEQQRKISEVEWRWSQLKAKAKDLQERFA